jgi:hypothetical protein
MDIRVFITADHDRVVEGIRSKLLPEKNIEWMGNAIPIYGIVECKSIIA